MTDGDPAQAFSLGRGGLAEVSPHLRVAEVIRGRGKLPSSFLQQRAECPNFLFGHKTSSFLYREKNVCAFLPHGPGFQS